MGTQIAATVLRMIYLGMMPGSEKLVLRRFERTKMKSTAPTNGMTGETLRVRKGQSKAKKSPEVPMTRRRVT